MNLYAMVGNDAVNKVDYRGLLSLNATTIDRVDRDLSIIRSGLKSYEIRWDVTGQTPGASGVVLPKIEVKGGFTECATGKTYMFNFERTEFFEAGGTDLWEVKKPKCSAGWIRFYAKAAYAEGYQIPQNAVRGHPLTKDAPSVPGFICNTITRNMYTKHSNYVPRAWSVRWDFCAEGWSDRVPITVEDTFE